MLRFRLLRQWGSSGGTHSLGCGSLHCGSHCPIFRVNISLRNRNVAVAGEIGQRERVHLRCPTRQEGVAQTVKLERLANVRLEKTLIEPA